MPYSLTRSRARAPCLSTSLAHARALILRAPRLMYSCCFTGARGDVLIAATERPLDGDGPVAAAGQTAAVRIAVFDPPAAAGAEGSQRRTTRYPLEALDGNGLVDVQALGTADSPRVSLDDAVLTLERAQTVEGGYRVQLFETHIESRRDVSDCASFADGGCSTPADAVAKRPLLDFNDLGHCSQPINGETQHLCSLQQPPGTWSPVRVDNFKAMAIGPSIEDGRRTLLLVSDDDYSAEAQGTHFVLLALDEDVERAGVPNLLTAEDDEPLNLFVVVGLVIVVIVARRVYVIHYRVPQDDPIEEELQQKSVSDDGAGAADGAAEGQLNYSGLD